MFNDLKVILHVTLRTILVISGVTSKVAQIMYVHATHVYT
jgi:hypothetical protein